MTDKLTLVSHQICPFVQRAAIVLAEKDVPFERITIDLQNKPDWFLAISPLSKVPLLKIDHGNGKESILFESMVICEYLEETQPAKPLYPAAPLDRAQARAWVEFGSAALQDAWAFLNAKDRKTADERSAAFHEKLKRLEVVVGGPFFAGESFSMVDVVFAPVFRYFDLLGPAIPSAIFDDLAAIGAWRQALAERDSVQRAVGPDYRDHLMAHLRRAGALLGASPG